MYHVHTSVLLSPRTGVLQFDGSLKRCATPVLLGAGTGLLGPGGNPGQP